MDGGLYVFKRCKENEKVIAIVEAVISTFRIRKGRWNIYVNLFTQIFSNLNEINVVIFCLFYTHGLSKSTSCTYICKLYKCFKKGFFGFYDKSVEDAKKYIWICSLIKNLSGCHSNWSKDKYFILDNALLRQYL